MASRHTTERPTPVVSRSPDRDTPPTAGLPPPALLCRRLPPPRPVVSPVVSRSPDRDTLPTAGLPPPALLCRRLPPRPLLCRGPVLLCRGPVLLCRGLPTAIRPRAPTICGSNSPNSLGRFDPILLQIDPKVISRIRPICCDPDSTLGMPAPPKPAQLSTSYPIGLQSLTAPPSVSDGAA